MKKIVSLIITAVMLISMFTVFADSYENRVYTFTAVNTTATFNADGEAVSIDNEDVLRFDANQVTMNLEGDADNAMLQQVILTKYDNSEITYTLASELPLRAVLFKDGNFEELTIDQGAYLLVLSTIEEKGSAVMLLVGEQTVVPEGTEPAAPSHNFGENAVLSDWAITEVTEAYDNSLITVELYRNANYKRNITRCEFAHVMTQLLIQCGADYDAYVAGLGDNPTFKFTDTNGDLEIEFVSHLGIINGMSETEFAPDAVCTREQIVTFLYRAAISLGKDVSVGEDTNILSYDDAFDIGEWAIPAVQWACGAGVMNGTSESTLSPQMECSRGQIVTFLYRTFR